jgi:hypothetical protein
VAAPIASSATDSHTQRGVVSLLIPIAHVLKRRFLGGTDFPGRATMPQAGPARSEK